jgi:hypothetical protein
VSRLSAVALRTVVAWLFWQRAASASGSQVVILHEDAPDETLQRVETRLVAELRAAGFEVEERVYESANDARRTVEQGAEARPFATVLLQRAIGEAFTDVWIADHVTHKTVVRRVAARGLGERADRALALSVVELMRASLVEGLVMSSNDDSTAGWPPAAPPPDVAAWTRAAVQRSPNDHAPFELGLGVAGALAGPELGIAAAPELRLAWRPLAPWSVALLAAGPAFGSRVTASEGTATLRQEFVVAEAAVEPGPRGAIRPYLAAGAGAYHFAATGYAAAAYTSRSDDVWSTLLAAGFGVRLHLGAATSLVLDARELFALPRPTIVFAGREVAVSMRPGTMAALAISVSLP